MSELQAHNAREKDSLLPVGYLTALNRALDELAEDYTWEAVHHHGDVDTAISEIILAILGDTTGFAPVDPVIFWGCTVLGPRVTFIYCRRDQIPNRFLIPS